MIVGALLDAGVPLAAIAQPLEAVAPGEFTVSAESVSRQGIAATKFHVHPTENNEKEHRKPAHRGLRDLLELVDNADLSPWVSEQAHRCFTRLCNVEAAIHGTTPDKVHLHELGAIDSIADVIGALLALDHISPSRIFCAPIATGHGTIDSAHGQLPLPAPATLRLLEDFPTRPGTWGPQRPISAELCTPTGAVLLSTLAEPVDAMPALRVKRSGYGAGSREDPGVANVVRVVEGDLLEADAAADYPAEDLMQLECVLDDMPGEWLGYLFERLHAAGAVEVTTQPVGLKKSRPGILLRALVPTASLAAVRDGIFAETTTFGLRFYPVRRFVLARRHVQVDTPWGQVRIKLGEQDGRLVTAGPEYEDCRLLAEKNDVPLREVFAAAQQAFRSQG